MRPRRDIRPLQLYAITQRGNQGQWVYRDDQDFGKALELMGRHAKVHGVMIHGWCLLHNHGHWVFEASTKESISNLMRDMQSQYSRYLNKKYAADPTALLGPLEGPGERSNYSKYRRAGPVNWTPRFDSVFLNAEGLKSFLRYLENNPAAAGMVPRAAAWKWSSARAHCKGSDAAGMLCLDRWQHFFGNPETMAADWVVYLDGPRVEALMNAARTRGAYNRVRGWIRPDAGMRVGAPPG